jgi:apolipoprotein N-acyltransferase
MSPWERTPVFEQRQRPPALEFLAGLFAGLGIILLTFLIMVLASFILARIWTFRGSGNHATAAIWAVLAFAMGLFLFRRRAPEHRRSSFTAGLVTAAALFLLLNAACWDFTLS